MGGDKEQRKRECKTEKHLFLVPKPESRQLLPDTYQRGMGGRNEPRGGETRIRHKKYRIEKRSTDYTDRKSFFHPVFRPSRPGECRNLLRRGVGMVRQLQIVV